MPKQAFIVTGLGYGDEGKGTSTHWLSVRHKAHTVIRTGGPQALHRVVCIDGTDHVFSQFGSGTPRGAATHLSKHMLIDPHGILEEGNDLRHEHGFNFVFEAMTIHEDALVITPFQRIAGRVRELLRGKHRLGSVGMGVGETMLDSLTLGDLAISAKDLSSPTLRKKLEAIQEYKWKEFEQFADRASDLPQESADQIRSELAKMSDSDTVQWAVERFTELANRVRIVDTDYVARQILGSEGAVVFEGSQGVLLDRWYGFHPYTTKVCATPQSAKAILNECAYDGHVESLGILRAYHTRHGGGPFVTESKEMTADLPDVSNKVHAWQGSFRVGYFDLPLARYAVEACKQSIDGIILTCVDRILPGRRWEICAAYKVEDDSREYVIRRLPVHHEMEYAEQLKKQMRTTALLEKCEPQLCAFDLPKDEKSAIGAMKSILSSSLATPVVAISVGESESDKIVF